MTTLLNFGRDVQGYNAFAPEFSDIRFSATLATGVHSSITVPSNFKEWIIVFSYQPGTTVWVARNAPAAVPAGGVFASTTSEELPGPRKVFAGDVIDLISNNVTTEVGILLYAIA